MPDGVDFENSFRTQVDVVRNERRQRYDNVPYGKALFARYAALFPEGHPYRYLTIGKHEDLVAASLDDVRNFFKTWYVPANATLTLVGDFEVATAKKLVEKWFGSFPKSTKPVVQAVPAPAIQSAEVTLDDTFAKLRQVTFTWHSPARYAAGDAELSIAASALTREGVGRLYKALVYDRPIAQSVSAFQGGASFSGSFTLSVVLRTEGSIDEVKRVVAAEIAKLSREPLAQKEIDRVVASLESSTIRRLESVMGRASTLQTYNHYLGDPDKTTWDLDRFRKATPETIRTAVAKHLAPDRVVTIITLPAGGAK
jgi:predicted Zn-dependent peptidase